MDHIRDFFAGAALICREIDVLKIEQIAAELVGLRNRGGRLFILGVGGSAGNASHAVNDFRKLCGIEAYAPTDNVSELTARTNDEGWETVFTEWLKVSRLSADDAILVFSVGGGNVERNISPNLVSAVKLAQGVGARILGVVGKADGFTALVGDAVVVVPAVREELITPFSEGFQAVVWHSLVSHPSLQVKPTKW